MASQTQHTRPKQLLVSLIGVYNKIDYPDTQVRVHARSIPVKVCMFGFPQGDELKVGKRGTDSGLHSLPKLQQRLHSSQKTQPSSPEHGITHNQNGWEPHQAQHA